MATTYKTPGVYIEEPDSFPPSIVAVETAVPAFIGFTERAMDPTGKSLLLAPTRIESMAEFMQLFGGMYRELYYLEPWADTERPKPKADTPTAAETKAIADWEADVRSRVGEISLGGARYRLKESPGATFNLYNSLRLFYANGGGPCYIVSCGDYAAAPATQPLLDGLDAVANVIGPTMLVVPDAVLLPAADYAAVMNEALQQCGERQDRIVLVDVRGADSIDPSMGPIGGQISATIGDFRGSVGTDSKTWRYGAAYFPFLETSIVQPTEVDLGNFDLAKPRRDLLVAALGDEVNRLNAADGSTVPEDAPALPALPATGTATATALKPVSARSATLFGLINDIPAAPADGEEVSADQAAKTAVKLRQTSQTLVAAVPALKQLFQQMAAAQNELPPSGAIAGIYAMNDAVRGVWNAPANVGIVGLIAPSAPITDDDQKDLNVPLNGKAVNAIRTFPGRGTLVWGARTLDSNSNDWRYIQVRRTMIFIEQSVKTALNAFVFAPNTAQTWVTVASMIESFLHGVWSAGGLMGASPNEAYKVQVGLGSTMTPTDVLEGRMIVQITLQMVRPAEFIVLTFRQQMLAAG